MPTVKADIARKVYDDMVDKKTCPTIGSFFLAVFEAGMIEFEKYYQEQNSPQRPAIEIDPATDQPVPEGTL